MARNHHLITRGGVYYFRIRVPTDLVDAYGRTHLQQSLKTKDYREAVRARDALRVVFQAQFDGKRRGRKAGVPILAERANGISVAVSRRLVDQWMQRALQLVAIGSAEIDGIDDAAHRDRIAELEDDLRALETQNARSDASVSRVSASILAENGYPTAEAALGTAPLASQVRLEEPLPGGMTTLQELVRSALVTIVRTELAALRGEPITALPSLAPPGAQALTLDELIEAFTTDPGRTAGTDKTKLDYDAVFGIMREVIGGHVLSDAIERDHLKDIRSLLLSLPPNVRKRFPGRPLRQVAAENHEGRLGRLAPKTVNLHLAKINTIFRWAEAEGYVSRNPASGLRLKSVKSHSRDARLPFSNEQLKLIFHAPLYTGCRNDGAGYAEPGTRRPRGTRFWIPLLALFQGMRLNEICQLRCSDISDKEKIACISVQEGGADQRVKTEASRRVIPVHPGLLRFGFLDFVQLRAKGSERLFPDLKLDGRGYYSDAFQKWFSRFLYKCGANCPKTSFHSFRHNWRDRLREAQISREVGDALGGWTDHRVSASYGRGFSAAVLFQEISKVDYPNLCLRHLQV